MNFRMLHRLGFAGIALALLVVTGVATTPAYAAKAVKVVVGTSDIAPPGTDANFSMIAEVDKYGNVSGTWTDSFGQNGRIQARVTCVWVDGNRAWIKGTVTNEANSFFIGADALTSVVDGGGPGGTGDFISFTALGPPGGIPDCSTEMALPLVAFGGGNVSIKQ